MDDAWHMEAVVGVDTAAPGATEVDVVQVDGFAALDIAVFSGVWVSSNLGTKEMLYW